MSGTAFAIVLCAALLHASWNAMIKASGDRAVSLGLIALAHMLLGGAAAAFAALPSPTTFLFIAASTVIHWLYYLLIYHAYRVGDLSLVYPIARGAAPVLVTLGALLALGEAIPPLGWAGILAVSCGAVLASWRGAGGQVSSASVLLAFATGAVIAGYSVVDGAGVRHSGDTYAYVAWLFLFEGAVFLYLVATRPLDFVALSPRTWALGLFGGAASAVAYGLAIYAMSIAPIALVSALRETSVMFAALIGVVWLGERPWRPRLVAAAVMVAGIGFIALV